MDNILTSQIYSSESVSYKNYLILFIIWPFMAFITAIANYNQKESRRIVYFFLIYYGLTFVNTNEGVDAFRYSLSLKANAALPFSEFFNIVRGLYGDTTVDIFEPLISFIVSRFTSNYNIYFAVLTSIFGFFYLKSINFFHDSYRKNPGWGAFFLMAFFVMILPITSVSGVRMPIATWIFFYGAIHVILYRDAKYLILTFTSSLVHWSFISVNVVLLIYFIAGNRNFIYLPLVLMSFILPSFFGPLFSTISLRLGGVFQSRYEGYSSEGLILGIQESREQASWFLKIADNLVFYFIILAIVAIQLLYKSRDKSNGEKNLYSFVLLFLAIVNFGKVVPTFGGRFQQVFYLFAALYIFLYLVKEDGYRLNFLIWLGLFPMLLYSAINFRLGSESINAFLLTPGLGVPLFSPALSIAELLFH